MPSRLLHCPDDAEALPLTLSITRLNCLRNICDSRALMPAGHQLVFARQQHFHLFLRLSSQARQALVAAKSTGEATQIKYSSQGLPHVGQSAGCGNLPYRCQGLTFDVLRSFMLAQKCTPSRRRLSTGPVKWSGCPRLAVGPLHRSWAASWQRGRSRCAGYATAKQCMLSLELR